MIAEKTRQSDVPVNNEKNALSEANKRLFIDLCYSHDPIQTYSNLIQFTTQSGGKLYNCGSYVRIYRECGFDLMHQCSLDDLDGVFRQIYTGFQVKYDGHKAKRKYQKKGRIIYSFHAMEKCCSDHLQESDYYYAQKKQKVRIEEFMYIAYLITHRYLQIQGSVILATNFLLCDYHREKYQKCTGRKLNKHKLFFIIDKLFKAEIIAKRKIGGAAEKHQRVLYPLMLTTPITRPKRMIC